MKTKVECDVMVTVESDNVPVIDGCMDAEKRTWSVFIGCQGEVEIESETLSDKEAVELADGIVHALRVFDKVKNKADKIASEA